MQRKALAITNGYSLYPSVSHFVKRMKEELGKRGVELGTKKATEIVSLIQEDGNLATRLPSFDFVLYLDKDKYLARMLEKLGYRLFDSAEAIEDCDDKMLTYLLLANHGVKMPKTMSGSLCYPASSFDFSYLDEVEKEIPYPIVVKSNFGSLGKQVHLAKNREELEELEKELIHEPRLYQEAIVSSFGFDYRVIVIGGRCVAAMKRVSLNGDFRSNLGLGGEGEKVELSPSYIALAEKAAKILKLDYCGVDLLSGKEGEPILCEVNSNAFLQGIEKVTGQNIAGVYADYLISKVYRTEE